MADYIKRADAIKAFDPKERRDWYTPWIVETLKDLPPADVAPVRHGRNVYMDVIGHCEFKCSLCGADALTVEGGKLDGGLFNYCPNCGAKMDEEVE